MSAAGRAGAALAGAALAVLAGAGGAAAAWLPAEAASRGAPARQPDVAMNARGDAAIAWTARLRGRPTVVATVRAAGGAWERPRRVSPLGRAAIDPAVAVTGSGRVVLAWRQAVRTRKVRSGRRLRTQAVYVARVRERELEPRAWGPIVTLSSSVQKVGPPRIAVDDAGAAVAAWHWGTGTRPGSPGFVGQVQAAERPAGGAWSGPRRMSRSSWCREVRRPRVAMSGDGYSIAWWQCDVRGGSTTMAVARDRAPAAWSAETELRFRTDGDQAVDVGLGDDGLAVATAVVGDRSLRWWRGRAGTAGVALSPLPAPGGPERPATEAGRPALAVTGAGDALSGWTDALRRPRVAPINPKLGVAAPVSLRTPGAAAGVRVGIGASRRGVVAWLAAGRVLAVTRDADGALSAPRALSGRGSIRPDDSPRVAVDAAGGALVVWSRGDRRGRSVELAEFAPSTSAERRARTFR